MGREILSWQTKTERREAKRQAATERWEHFGEVTIRFFTGAFLFLVLLAMIAIAGSLLGLVIEAWGFAASQMGA